MTQPTFVDVVTANGLKGSLDRAVLDQAAPSELVGIKLENGQQLWVVPGSLLPQSDGRFLLPVAVPQTEAPGSAPQASQETTIVPVVAEEAVVSKKRTDRGGVRISKTVHEREEVAQLPLLQEQVDVRREPAEEWVAGTEPARQEGDTWIVPVYEEVLVVEKRLRLRERLFVTKRQTYAEHRQPVALRHEEAVVERLEPEPGADAAAT
jgi:uncharacterized protein (TIGR02271 family)